MITKTNEQSVWFVRALIVLGITGTVMLSGCQTMSSKPVESAYTSLPTTDIYSSIPMDKLNTGPRKITADGIRALDANDFERASDLFNLAVKTDITNSYLQFLNGLAYHLRGLQGENSLLPLAETGYKLAIQFDDTNWLAQYYLGMLYLDQRKFEEAKNQLANAALYVDDDPDLLYNLALAAYYSKDLTTADAALRGARKLSPGISYPHILRASAIISAATNAPEQADEFLDKYREVTSDSSQHRYVKKRMQKWSRLNKALQDQGFSLQPAQFLFDNNSGNSADAMNQTYDSNSPGMSASEDEFIDKDMVVVDVTIIRTEEDINTSMGVNLLQGLQLQFGNSDDGTVAFSKTRSFTKDADNTFNNTNSRSLTRFISIPAVTYSLNIANSNSARNEVLARPSLVALSGETSEFFSGVDITGAAVSGGDGDSVSVEKEVGVKLAVTPEFLPNDHVKLSIQAERTFLTNPSASVVFDFRLDTTKTIVNSNVVMRFGETLILSGLSEKELESNRDGVPVLQDIPLLQYGFSRRTSRDFLKSVLILVTPRRAQYTYQDEADKQADRSRYSNNDLQMAEFEDKFKDLFKPQPNTAPVFSHLQDNSVYREFRTGDLTMQSWNTLQSHGDRLREATRFIYY